VNDPAPQARAPKHAVILCHPAPTSFNAAVAGRYCETARVNGHEVVFRDLYRIGFDPVLKASERPSATDFRLAEDVAREIVLIGDADIFVLVYPLWFGTPPAMLKGYVERVLGSGFSHDAVRKRTRHPMLTGKRLLSFTTSGTAKPWLQEQGAWMSLRNVFDMYLARAFSMRDPEHVHFGSIVEGMKERSINENLYKVETEARRICADVAVSVRARRSVKGRPPPD
jgi:NAD(P)H dehydrogenase (quinone)